jgi:hypothetical protein
LKDRKKMHRRLAGLVNARVPELELERVSDPRRRDKRRRWPLAPVLRTTLLGLAAGARSCGECEALTEDLSPAGRKLLGIKRRLPDTTQRDILVKLAPDEIRACLRRQARQAHRRGSLRPSGLPFGVVAMDGKHTAITAWDEAHSQRQGEGAGSESGVHGVVRTFTCTLVSSRAKACLDAAPIPSATNEMGHFAEVFDGLMRSYGRSRLFSMVTADAGSCSNANGEHVVEAGRHYLFGLKQTQPTLHTEARAQLARRDAAQADAVSEDVTTPTLVTRRLYLTQEMAGFEWDHLQTVLRVEVEKVHLDTGQVFPMEEDDANRYYVSSLPPEALTPSQWLELVRRHWGVENGCHHTFDTAFAEDDRPWIVNDPQGMVVVLLLRRMAYNLIALFRDVTQRSEDKRGAPWKTLLRWMNNMLIALTEPDLSGLRERMLPAVAGD